MEFLDISELSNFLHFVNSFEVKKGKSKTTAGILSSLFLSLSLPLSFSPFLLSKLSASNPRALNIIFVRLLIFLAAPKNAAV